MRASHNSQTLTPPVEDKKDEEEVISFSNHHDEEEEEEEDEKEVHVSGQKTTPQPFIPVMMRRRIPNVDLSDDLSNESDDGNEATKRYEYQMCVCEKASWDNLTSCA